MLQLEIEDSSDEEESLVDDEAQSSRMALTAYTNTSHSTVASNGSSRRVTTASSSSSRLSSSPSNRFFLRNNSSTATNNTGATCSSRWCFFLGWLWNGGGQSSSSSYSRWIRRFAILGMASLLLYHATPTNWNAVSSDGDETSSKITSTTMNNNDEQYIPSSPTSSEVDDDEEEDITISHSKSNSDESVVITDEKNGNGDGGDTTTNNNAVISYSCPTTVEEPKNLQGTGGDGTWPHQNLLVPNNINTTAYLSVFHTLEYDEWPRGGISYDRVKAAMYEWKTSRFAQNLKDGNAIYESASGIGLNLAMTLEILQEATGGDIENLVVYGNDYSADSIRVAQELVQGGILSPMHGQLGTFCRADSTKLHEFVPPNAFDLVFTGYITPLQDPLQLNNNLAAATTQDDLDREYRSICQEGTTSSTIEEEDEQTTTTTTRAADMQRRQEDWYGAWVDEMIRIAKPGAPVIVEQVSSPYCEAFFDGGGVSQDFWRVAVERYDWDVDIDSIAFENDAIMNKRYHVFMRKNNHDYLDASDQALEASGIDDHDR